MDQAEREQELDRISRRLDVRDMEHEAIDKALAGLKLSTWGAIRDRQFLFDEVKRLQALLEPFQEILKKVDLPKGAVVAEIRLRDIGGGICLGDLE